jgi:hypothetical protein
MKFPFNKFTNNLVFFLILSFIIIIYYFFFFRYKEGATSTTIYSVQTYSSTPTIVPPACNLMTNDRCSQNSGFCMWDSLTSGCLNKFDCTNLNQTTCSKQNYCTWNSSINKCSVKT